MASFLGFRVIILGVIAAAVALLYTPVNQRITTVGLRRPADKIPNVHGHETKEIPNTHHCEDVHYHAESGLLFTACQTKGHGDRYSWFPPLGHFENHHQAKGGALVVVDPKTFESQQLELQGFSLEFVTHGIDVVSDASDPESVYIFAVNHLPNPRHYLPNDNRNDTATKARSQVEIFTHKIGSGIAVHKRSVRSPLITTPNDILATGPTGFYVTNDHHYREGIGRLAEDALTRGSAPWSSMIFVAITDSTAKDPEKGFSASVVLRELHNNNGLGHPGPDNKDDILVTDASGGVLYRLKQHPTEQALELFEEIQLPICLDNPSWYEDPYKTADDDASGYIANGLARGVDIPKYLEDPKFPAPIQVYHIRANGSANAEKHASWEQRLLYSDIGVQPRTVSGAAIVPIDPKENDGKKQGWLFMTGFLSESMVASRVDL